MPYIIQGETNRNPSVNYSKSNFNYRYPNGLKLKPGTELHDKIVSNILYRATESRTEVSNRFPSWREVDRTLNVYIPLADDEKILKEEDSTKPVSIVFPYTYSTMESLLTYLTMAFFQDPIFQYEGIDDDDTIGAMLMELVVKMHCIKNKVPLALHTILRDCLTYGVGIGIPGWRVVKGKRPIRSMITSDSGMGSSTEHMVSYIDDIIFEGNELYSISPYMWLPDVSCSSNNIQDMEYFGWVERTNYMKLLSSEEQNLDAIFNVKYLSLCKNKRSILATDPSDRDIKTNISSNVNKGTTNPIDLIKMYVTLIPKEWGLGGSESPEKWFFVIGSDDVIIQCERAEHHHGMYPAAVASPEADGYSPLPIGRLEILYGMQNTLDFMFNSHVTNIRKTINDMLVVDPSLINIEDLKSPKPGKLIRLRKPVWGRGVDKAVQQLNVNDVTRGNVADAAYLTQMMDRISAADQSMQGSLRTGGPDRLTKSEFQGTRMSAMTRLQRMSFIISQQLMQDLGTMFGVHTQEYMRKETYVKLAGRYAEKLTEQFGRTSKKVTPYDIAINYDTVIRDGSIPGGNFSDAWMRIFDTVGNSPELMQEFDITKIFTYIASQLGAKNIDDFKKNVGRIQTQTMPDQQVADEVKKGNMVPYNQMGEI